MKIVIFIFFSLLINVKTFAKESRESFFYNILSKERILPQNFLWKFSRIKKAIFKDATTLRFSTDNYLLNIFPNIILNKGSNELVSWNYFLLLDFIFQFNLQNKFSIKNNDNLLSIRNMAYAKWLNTIDWRNDHSFLDHSETKWQGKSIDEYLNAKSKNFNFFIQGSELINRQPNPRKKPLRRKIYNLLGAKSPFNSIFSKNILSKINIENNNNFKETILKSSRCLEMKITQSQQENSCSTLTQFLNECSINKSDELFLLGALSSQRMYLLRDLVSYLRDNQNELELQKSIEILSNGSKIYFSLESHGYRCGAKSLYPSDRYKDHEIINKNKLKEPKSIKPYHFYSVAYIANEAMHWNYPISDVINESFHYAKKYKNFISLITIPYHGILGTKIFSGTVSDKSIVKNEQMLGSLYGVYLYEKK